VSTWNKYGTFVSKRNAYILYPVNGTKTIQFHIYTGGAWTYSTYTPTFDITQWHHYAGTWDGTTIRLYVDGTMQDSDSKSGSMSDTGALTIGRDDGASRYLDGMLDEVRIYNAKLTDTEVAALAGQTALSVTNLTVNSSNSADYSIQSYALAASINQYGDRSDTFTTIPGKYLGATFIRTADDDALSTTADLLTFTVDKDVTVYVLHNDSYGTKPSWLSQFTDTTDNIVTTHGTFSVYKKVLSAGTITLGGNTADGSGDNGMYGVLLVPLL